MVLSIEKYLVPHHSRYRDIERPTEKRQNPTEKEDAATDHRLLDQVPVKYRTSLREQLPEHLVSDLNP